MSGSLFSPEALAPYAQALEQAPAPLAEHHSTLAPMLATALGQGADLLTTQAVLRAGGRELNPMMSSRPMVNGLEKGAGIAAMLLAIKKLADSGHPTAAKIVGYVMGGLGTSAAVHNAGER